MPGGIDSLETTIVEAFMNILKPAFIRKLEYQYSMNADFIL